MRHPAALTLAAATTLVVIIAGCGITNPYAQPTATTHAVTTTRVGAQAVTKTDADPGPERGGTIPTSDVSSQDRLAHDAGGSTPRVALERYAQLYINWTASTVAADQRELATISLGSARAQALQAAASYQHDTTLLKSAVTNTGAVVSIAKGEGTAVGDWVVVTSETTSGRGDYQGLPATLHVTYAQLTQTSTGWIVTAWEPRS
jgi:hypothetical protein